LSFSCAIVVVVVVFSALRWRIPQKVVVGMKRSVKQCTCIIVPKYNILVLGDEELLRAPRFLEKGVFYELASED
jgi:hypothetical protein